MAAIQLNGHESEQTLGDSEGQGILACCSPQDLKELDMTECLNEHMGSQNVRAGRVLKRPANPISFKGKETEP